MPPKASRNTGDRNGVKFIVPFSGKPQCPKCLPLIREYGTFSDLKKHITLKSGHQMDCFICCKYCNQVLADMKKAHIHIRSCKKADNAEVKAYFDKSKAPPPEKIQRVPNRLTNASVSTTSPTQHPPAAPATSQTSRVRQHSTSSNASSQNLESPSTPPIANRTRSKSRSRSTSVSSSAPSLQPPSQIVAVNRTRLHSIMEDSETPLVSDATPLPDLDELDAWVTTEAEISQQSNTLNLESSPLDANTVEQPTNTSTTDNDIPVYTLEVATQAQSFSPTASQQLPVSFSTSSDPWEKRFDSCQKQVEFEKIYDEYTVFLQSKGKSISTPGEATPEIPEQTQPQLRQPEHQPQQPHQAHHPPNPAVAGRRRPEQHRGKEYRPKKKVDIKAAKKLQHMYRINKKKAFTKITTEGPSQFCEIDPEIVTNHFEKIYAASDRQPTEQPPEVPLLEPVEGDSDPLSKKFTTAEVHDRLKASKNTAPGPDTINYNMLKKSDPTTTVLTSIFNAVLRLEHIPQSWNNSQTVLIHKKGSTDNISNWRPIALSNCISKLFASVLAHRLTSWAMANNRLSSSQKGFLPFEGCLEHNFELQSIIQHAKRTRTTALISWLDLENAFGSVPHSTIFQSLELAGVHEDSIKIIKLLYAQCTTTIRCSTGPTDPIKIQSGVKQGCPLSPIVFNFAIDPVLRAIEHLNVGIELHGRNHSVKGYADDLATIARSKSALQQQLDTATIVSNWAGFKFNGKKCATLHIDGKKKQAVASKFKIQDQQMQVLNEDQSYEHLGVPTGYKIQPSATETIQQMTEEVKKIDASLLAPWQKFDALNTFVLSKLNFHLKGGMVPKKPLNELDQLIKRLGKKWLNLPQQASPEILYLPYSRGGMNLLPTSLFADVSQVSHAHRLLTSNDPNTRQMAKDMMKDVVDKRMKKDASPEEIIKYYNGLFEGIPTGSNDYTSCWTRLRAATRRLQHKIDIEWQLDQNGEIVLFINNFKAQRKIVEIQLKDAVRRHFLLNLIKKPDQGKVFEVIANSPVANHFMHDGNFTRFAEWRFIHRARLGVVPLNGCRRYGNDNNKRCRRCGDPNETLPHVLNHCNPHMVTIKKRHDAILDRLIKATKLKPTQTIREDLCVPGVVSNLRPDLVIIDETNKTATIIDVCCPFENRHESLVAARKRKLGNYNDIYEQLKEQKYDVFLDAFVVGSLGGYDPENFKCLIKLGINRKYAELMKKLMVSETIKWSRNIYIEHVTGQRQY